VTDDAPAGLVAVLRTPSRALLSWIHNQADLTLYPSVATRADLELAGVRDVAVWSRGVDSSRSSPARRSRAWRTRLTGGRNDVPVLLFVGRLSPEKRVDWLRPLIDAIRNACLAVVGDRPSRGMLEELLPPTPTVFTGWLSGNEFEN
jgi:glycosyltransferase involved in cell wall biosynthesis